MVSEDTHVTIRNCPIVDGHERFARKAFPDLRICTNHLVHHGLPGWSIAKHIGKRAGTFLECPQINESGKMAFPFNDQAINKLLFTEDSTKIFDDFVNIHAPVAVKSSLHFFDRLAVCDRKTIAKSELPSSVMA